MNFIDRSQSFLTLHEDASFLHHIKTDGSRDAKEGKSDSSDSPMHQHPPTSLQPFLYKGITSGEMLYDILILNIVNVNDMMFEIPK